MRTFIIIVFISILATGCTKTNSDIDEINYICNKIAEDCAGNNSFLILKSTDIPSFKEKAKGYWVGPFYKGLLLSPNDKFISSKKLSSFTNQPDTLVLPICKKDTLCLEWSISERQCSMSNVKIIAYETYHYMFFSTDSQ